MLVGLAIRLGAIDFQSLWRDEVDTLRFGRDLSAQIDAALAGRGLAGMVDQLRQTLTQPGFNGPAYFLMLQAWTGAAGESEFALRFPSTWFGVLVIPLIYALALRLFRATSIEGQAQSIGLAAAGLATVSPYFVWYAQEAKMYAEITALALLAVYALRRAARAAAGQPAWPWWLLVVAATTLAMYSHILAALLVGVEVCLFAAWWPEARRHWRGALIALAALTLPYLPIVGWQAQLALTPGDQGFARYRFDEILRVVATGLAQGVIPFDTSLAAAGIHWPPGAATAGLQPAGVAMWLLSALAIVGVLMWKDASDRGPRLGLAAWVLAPAATVALISINRPIFTDRYLIWIGPAVYLLAALGLITAWRWNKPLGGAIGVVIAAVALIGLHGQAVTPFKSDFRSAARYVAARYQGEPIVFQIPYGQYAFDYYFGPSFPVVEGPYTNFRDANGAFTRDAASFDAEIAARISGHSAVWLVATEVEMWDERHVLEGWLAQHGRATERADFTRVSVTRFALVP